MPIFEKVFESLNPMYDHWIAFSVFFPIKSNDIDELVKICEQQLSQELKNNRIFRKQLFKKLETWHRENITKEPKSNFLDTFIPQPNTSLDSTNYTSDSTNYTSFNKLAPDEILLNTIIKFPNEFKKQAPVLFSQLNNKAACYFACKSIDWAILLLKSERDFSLDELREIVNNVQKNSSEITLEKLTIFCALVLLQKSLFARKKQTQDMQANLINILKKLIPNKPEIALAELLQSPHAKDISWNKEKIELILPHCYNNARVFLHFIQQPALREKIRQHQKDPTNIRLPLQTALFHLPGHETQNSLLNTSVSLYEALDGVLFPWPTKAQTLVRSIIKALDKAQLFATPTTINITIGFKTYQFNVKQLLLLIRSNETLFEAFRTELDRKPWFSNKHEVSGLDKLNIWTNHDAQIKTIFKGKFNDNDEYIEAIKGNEWFPDIETQKSVSVTNVRKSNSTDPIDSVSSTTNTRESDSTNSRNSLSSTSSTKKERNLGSNFFYEPVSQSESVSISSSTNKSKNDPENEEDLDDDHSSNFSFT